MVDHAAPLPTPREVARQVGDMLARSIDECNPAVARARRSRRAQQEDQDCLLCAAIIGATAAAAETGGGGASGDGSSTEALA